jgi:hypothetical protein
MMALYYLGHVLVLCAWYVHVCVCVCVMALYYLGHVLVLCAWYIHTYTHTLTHTYTYIHTRTHTYTPGTELPRACVGPACVVTYTDNRDKNA